MAEKRHFLEDDIGDDEDEHFEKFNKTSGEFTGAITKIKRNGKTII